MKKHFENLWEDIEVYHIMADPNFEIDSKFEKIREDLSNLSQDKDTTESFGRILFNLCAISRKLNVNVYTALVKEYQNQKIDLL
jgi:hypothetical protein